LWSGAPGPRPALRPSRILPYIYLFSLALATAQPRCVPPPPGLSAWFTFNEPLFRQPGEHRPQRVPGRVGSALKFNGKDQYFEFPASTQGVNMGEDDFTIELWVRTTDSQYSCSLVDKRDSGPLGYQIYLYRGHPGVYLADGDRQERVYARSVIIADNRWRHIAGVVKRLPPQPLELYIDGVKQVDDGGTTRAPLVNLDVPAPLWLGRHHANRYVQRDNIYFEGEIDELSFYHRALAAAEIRSIYRAGSRGKCRSSR